MTARPPSISSPASQDRRLGGVQHDRQRRGRGQPPGELAHVGDTVAADVVDAEVEHVGPVTDLVAGDLDAVVPALLEHRVAEGPRPVRVRALADGQEGSVLPEGHRLVQRCDADVLTARLARRDLPPAHALDHLAQVLGSGSAAPADQREAEVAGERVVRIGQLDGVSG
jgi:hypothetical protein